VAHVAMSEALQRADAARIKASMNSYDKQLPKQITSPLGAT